MKVISTALFHDVSAIADDVSMGDRGLSYWSNFVAATRKLSEDESALMFYMCPVNDKEDDFYPKRSITVSSAEALKEPS